MCMCVCVCLCVCVRIFKMNRSAKRFIFFKIYLFISFLHTCVSSLLLSLEIKCGTRLMNGVLIET